MTPSDKQLAANCRNAKSSTGPRTPAGKRKVSQNATTHGIFSRDVVVSDHESADDYDALVAALTDDLAPVGPLENLLVQRIATLTWRTRRVLRAEAGAVTLATNEAIQAPLARQAEDLEDNLQTVDMLGSDSPYAASSIRDLRRKVRNTGSGHVVLLGWLRDARAHIAGGQALPPPILARLLTVVGPTSDLGRLLTASEAQASTPDSVHPILAAFDARIAEAEASFATLRRRDQESTAHAIASNALPPDAAAAKILRYDAALGHALSRTLAELRTLQSRRSSSPQNPAD